MANTQYTLSIFLPCVISLHAIAFTLSTHLSVPYSEKGGTDESGEKHQFSRYILNVEATEYAYRHSGVYEKKKTETLSIDEK